MDIRMASWADLPFLLDHDRHVSSRELARAVDQGRVYVAADREGIGGWLRWGLFWDSIPFLNMLYLLEENRGKGLGRRLMERWEEDMRGAGHRRVLTSTASDETAQHFYYRLGYRAAGGFLLEGEPYEAVLTKNL